MAVEADKKRKWKETQLPYDSEQFSYRNYTKAIIRRGHGLVVEYCEQVARQNGGRLTVLDSGCGWTDFYGKLEHIIGSYVGIEPSLEELQRAESRENQFLIRGVGEKMLVRDSCIDIVLHIADLDHCFDAQKVVEESFRVLKPGGASIILLENRGRWVNDVRRMMRMEISHGDEHLYYFDVDDVLSLVKPFGEVNYARSYGFLAGFDWLSNALPKSFVSGLEGMSNKLFAPMFPTKGQHFIIGVVRRGGGPSFPLGFLCPNCGNEFEWKTGECLKCNNEIHWIHKTILDAIDKEAK